MTEDDFDSLKRGLSQAEMYLRGANEERARIVAWLRALPVPITDDVASMIEAGEHHDRG